MMCIKKKQKCCSLDPHLNPLFLVAFSRREPQHIPLLFIQASHLQIHEFHQITSHTADTNNKKQVEKCVKKRIRNHSWHDHGTDGGFRRFLMMDHKNHIASCFFLLGEIVVHPISFNQAPGPISSTFCRVPSLMNSSGGSESPESLAEDSSSSL